MATVATKGFQPAPPPPWTQTPSPWPRRPPRTRRPAAPRRQRRSFSVWTNEQVEAATGPTTFGKPKILDEGGHVKARMLPEELQKILTPKTSMAPCAAQRKSAVFVKRPALSSTPSPSSNPGNKSYLLISAHGQGTAHAPQTPLASLAGMALFVSEATPP